MTTVTERIRTISQPELGYPHGFIPVTDMNRMVFEDNKTIDISSPLYSHFSPIQGLATDYLTRLQAGFPPQKAFEISLMGALLVGQMNEALHLLSSIKGLDDASIIAACRLVCYDTAYRRGPEAFTGIDSVPDGSIISNIRIMVERSSLFFKRNCPIISVGFTFEGGYTSLVSKGDGDYLSSDSLWDLKATTKKLEPSETLQILVYYILGLHSTNPSFQAVKTIGIFNPLKNEAYSIPVNKISDRVYQLVSHDVIGYKVPNDPAQWRNAAGEDKDVLRKFLEYHAAFTEFDPEHYEDGIFDITTDDYWTYWHDKSRDTNRPKTLHGFPMKFIKHNGFYMFVAAQTSHASSAASEAFCIMHRGQKYKLSHSLQYYYDLLPTYGNTVLSIFSRYWDSLYRISSQLKSIEPDVDNLILPKYEKLCALYQKHGHEPPSLENYAKAFKFPFERSCFSGHVHGCIIDLDYSNHVFFNPYDGTITPYFGTDRVFKYVYENTASLISDRIPEMLPGFLKSGVVINSVLPAALSSTTLENMSSSEIDSNTTLVTDTSMYEVSRFLCKLQYIYDYHLVVDWNENLLALAKALPEKAP